MLAYVMKRSVTPTYYEKLSLLVPFQNKWCHSTHLKLNNRSDESSVYRAAAVSIITKDTSGALTQPCRSLYQASASRSSHWFGGWDDHLTHLLVLPLKSPQHTFHWLEMREERERHLLILCHTTVKGQLTKGCRSGKRADGCTVRGKMAELHMTVLLIF